MEIVVVRPGVDSKSDSVAGSRCADVHCRQRTREREVQCGPFGVTVGGSDDVGDRVGGRRHLDFEF